MLYDVREFRFTYCVLPGSAVCDSAHGLLEGDKYRFDRMPSVDAFNEVPVFIYLAYFFIQ